MNNNFNLTEKDINKKIKLTGWIDKIRKLGDLIFFDLRNSGKIIQVVVTNKTEDIYKIAKNLTKEDVILVEGVLNKRKNINKNLKTGTIEIIADNLNIISKAKTLPFIIADQTDGLEPLRMRYRYLDIRRNNVYNILKFRSNFNKLIRTYFDKLDFLEIETPTITKLTFGGASEFRVLSKNHPGYQYGLVQSPQIYKQLLMYGGIEKYYQIARCYRDEDLRKDRQLEFTQLDLEKSFTTKEEIKEIIENLLVNLFDKLLKIKVKKPFQTLKYQEAIDNYGIDKPDLRYPEKIYNFNLLKKDLNISLQNDQSLIGIYFPFILSESKIKNYLLKIKAKSDFSFLAFKENKLINTNLKNINHQKILNFIFLQKQNLKNSKQFSLILIKDKDLKAKEIIGKLRIKIAIDNKLFDQNQFNFVWVEDFPLFELLKDLKLGSMHNPFTNFKKDDFDLFWNLKINEKEELLKLNSEAYDIVLNGIEIGGGALRIIDPIIQKRIFEILNLKKKEIENDFAFLLEAQKYGIPTHGGIALGLDRLIAIMLKIDSIKEIIAFPKSSKGTDEMMGGPTKIE
ncbi:Aspartate--tRNA ligase [Candidatus Hepatoplasma crinochetorum Av]|uniref:Aspartate--tRNA ligase n=1 Tax=Candidatus Hepatoplasma crinochetorum Av TaxID=1427984 RepID=W8GNF6_9MOLU|nr:aspartate--tRNA ligase [Candidatus Hepatoplasma crinochetorum]AHK22556.1 Aspartate--tRNA ligase [Candidatus Hepatoplasma crinochetorum Av]